jgi:hypothetical protein
MHNKIRMISSLLAIFFAASLGAFAQESQSKTPVVTAEDVLRISRGNAGASAARRPANAPATEAQVQQDIFTGAERAWNERLKRAQQLVKDLLSRADISELEVTRLKNVLFSAERRSTQEHKGLIDEVDAAIEETRRLRAAAAVARVAVEEILAEGQASGFRVTSASLTDTIGSSGPVYYRSRYNELQNDLGDAERRADVLQTRVNTLRGSILLNSRTGDEFYINRVRENMQDTQDELNETLNRVIAIRDKITELRQQARAAGVVIN